MKSPKAAGKALESEIEGKLLELTGQTRDVDIRERSHRIFTSGSQVSDEGDVITNIPWLSKQFLIECKRRKTSTKKYGPHIDVRFEWLNQIKREAETRGCRPVFIGSFTGCKSDRLFALLLDCEVATAGTSVAKANKEKTSFRITRTAVQYLGHKIFHLYTQDDSDAGYIMSLDRFLDLIKEEKK